MDTKTTTETKPCSGCSYPLSGNETEDNCPVCAPISRMKQLSAQRKRTGFFLEYSQPKELNV